MAQILSYHERLFPRKHDQNEGLDVAAAVVVAVVIVAATAFVAIDRGGSIKSSFLRSP